MKLFYSKGACSLAVRIIINEIGLTCDYEAVNLANKTTENAADYLKINPKGSVPALLLDDHTVLTENIAIQIYIAEKNNAVEMLPPPNDFRRYRVIEWLSFISSELHKSCGPLFNSAIPEQLKNQIFKPNLRNRLQRVENHLSQNTYLLDIQFTLADTYLFVILRWMPHLNIDMTEWPHLTKYFAELKTRKSIALSLEQEGIILE